MFMPKFKPASPKAISSQKGPVWGRSRILIVYHSCHFWEKPKEWFSEKVKMVKDTMTVVSPNICRNRLWEVMKTPKIRHFCWFPRTKKPSTTKHSARKKQWCSSLHLIFKTVFQPLLGSCDLRKCSRPESSPSVSFFILTVPFLVISSYFLYLNLTFLHITLCHLIPWPLHLRIFFIQIGGGGGGEKGGGGGGAHGGGGGRSCSSWTTSSVAISNWSNAVHWPVKNLRTSTCFRDRRMTKVKAHLASSFRCQVGLLQQRTVTSLLHNLLAEPTINQAKLCPS